jgi:hypothetical protein
MDYAVDLDPTHSVLRITVTTAVTDEVFRDIYQAVARLASQGGPYAALFDFSQVVDYPVSSDTIRAVAAARPAIPGEKPRVVVAPRPAQYGLSRMYEMCRDSMGVQIQVVQSMDEAYELLKVTPQDFTQHLFPEDVAA